jgi:hypothetical protein
MAAVPDSEKVFAVGSYAYDPNEMLREEARILLRSAMRESQYQGYCDFSHFVDAINSQFQESSLTQPLTRFLFETSPNPAFLIFVHEAPSLEEFDLRRAERTISNAIFELDWATKRRAYVRHAKSRGLLPKDTPDSSSWSIDESTARTRLELAQSKYWWARLFIAETMVQHKELRDKVLLEAFEKDESELVRRSVASIRNPDPLRVTKVDD